MGLSKGTSTTSATNAMNIVFYSIREIVVDNIFDILDIYTKCTVSTHTSFIQCTSVCVISKNMQFIKRLHSVILQSIVTQSCNNRYRETFDATNGR
jgi:hypothetical protein